MKCLDFCMGFLGMDLSRLYNRLVAQTKVNCCLNLEHSLIQETIIQLQSFQKVLLLNSRTYDSIKLLFLNLVTKK